MDFGIVPIVLLAAGLHAGWNALVKIQGDRLIVMAVITFFGSLFSLLFAPFVAFPDSASWLSPWFRCMADYR